MKLPNSEKAVVEPAKLSDYSLNLQHESGGHKAGKAKRRDTRSQKSGDRGTRQEYHLHMTEVTLTTVYEEAEEGGYIGYVAELPGANTQGETMEEVRENLAEAIQLIFEANREAFEKQLPPGSKVKREQLTLRAA